VRPTVERQNIKYFTKMLITDLLLSGTNVTVAAKAEDLLEFAKVLISQTRNEIEAEIIAAKAEELKTRKEACDFLKVDQSSLWRWSKRGYLVPIEVGGRRMYRLSDLKRILNGCS